MYREFTSLVNLFERENRGDLLLKGKWGLEKESQRVLPTGDLALTPHPAVFGERTKNQNITTDFSESQIELITPPFQTIEEVHEFLVNLEAEVLEGINDELLWPLSMPPKLPEEENIPIAKFNDSKEGKENGIYREGLALRYGKKMQMISGIHYNFSFSEDMFDFLRMNFDEGKEKRLFRDEVYFSLTRNYLRYHWLLIYLFGASPVVDPTYHSVIRKEIKEVLKCCPECCDSIESYEQYATSLRVSRFGYSNTLQRKNSVFFNSLEEYSKGLRKLLASGSKKYQKLGLFRDGSQVQLNGNILQKESEFYSPIRLKQITEEGETQLDALEKRGVKYVEARIFDLNPYEKIGISLEQLYFLQVFMLFCLFEENKSITVSEMDKINKNHHLTALSGRKHRLMLYSYFKGRVPLKNWGEEIFKKLIRIARMLDEVTCDSRYQSSVDKEFEKLSDVSLLPSSMILKEMDAKNESFLDFGVKRSIGNKKTIHEV